MSDKIDAHKSKETHVNEFCNKIPVFYFSVHLEVSLAVREIQKYSEGGETERNRDRDRGTEEHRLKHRQIQRYRDGEKQIQRSRHGDRDRAGYDRHRGTETG